MESFLDLLEIVKRKSIYDEKSPWCEGSKTYLEEIVKEVEEVIEEIPKNRTNYLEDELADILWDYLNIVVALEEEKGVSLKRVLHRACTKYDERISGITKGKKWADIKALQKETLEREYRESFLRLESPDFSHEKRFFTMLSTYEEAGESVKYYETSYPTFLTRLESLKRGEDVNLPQTHYFFVINGLDEIIGTLRIRSELNQVTSIDGGHVGYDLSPSQRGKGLGKKVMALIKETSKVLGLESLLITIESDNISSRRMIESGGGGIYKEEKTSPLTRKAIRHYHLSLKE